MDERDTQAEQAEAGSRALEDASRALAAYITEIRRLVAIRPPAPPALLARVGRWFSATFVRELAWQLSALTATVLAALVKFGGLRHRLGRLAGLGLGLVLVKNLRHAVAAHRSAADVEEALEGLPASGGRRVPLAHVAIPPLMFVASDVKRERGVVFSEPEQSDGVRLRLDIYRCRDASAHEGPRPAVIQVHGGGWLSGSRLEQGIPLLNHLAGLGWTGFNIDYRLSPQATWPDHIVDVKRAIAWVRENAAELNVDPTQIAITGGSAGGHLTALAALTVGDPDFQPGFESADTSVLAAVPFYGVYDFTNERGHYYPPFRDWVLEQVVIKRPMAGNEELYRAASPRLRIHPDAPPFMVVHGDRDTLVPVGDARDFVAELERTSTSEVRYLELAGAEHAFDLWPSVRTARVADAIGRFLNFASEARTEASGAESQASETDQTDQTLPPDGIVQTAGSTSN